MPLQPMPRGLEAIQGGAPRLCTEVGPGEAGVAPEPEPAPAAKATEASDHGVSAECSTGGSLQEQFLTAEALLKQIKGGKFPSGDDKTQELVRRCLAGLQRCTKMVAEQALFSSNEDADDVNTAHLKFLLLPYYTGDILLRQSTPGGPVCRRSRALRLLLATLADH